MSAESSPDGRTITITIPARLNDSIREAAREIKITQGEAPTDEKLLVQLIEHGARACAAYRVGEDARHVGSVSVAELASIFGLADLEETRRLSMQQRESQAKSAEHAMALFSDLQGLRQVHSNERFEKPEELDVFIGRLKQAMSAHPELAIVIASAFVDTSTTPPNYTEIVSSARIN